MSSPFSTMATPIFRNNPVLVQVLGICSSLAVTTNVSTGLTMGISVTAVVALSNLILSSMRNWIPGKIRMIVELVVIAVLVIITDQVLKAYAFDVSKRLSVFVALIITNCIVMGRVEAFALANKPLPSLLDGIGNGLGYGAVLILVSTVREIAGSGTWFGLQVVPQAAYEAGYANMGLMVLAPGAFFLIALLAWAQTEFLLRKGGK